MHLESDGAGLSVWGNPQMQRAQIGYECHYALASPSEWAASQLRSCPLEKNFPGHRGNGYWLVSSDAKKTRRKHRTQWHLQRLVRAHKDPHWIPPVIGRHAHPVSPAETSPTSRFAGEQSCPSQSIFFPRPSCHAADHIE